MARILVTGFGPFPAANDNPSGQLVERLARHHSLRLPLEPVFSVLPTLWQEAGKAFSQLVAEHQPNLAVHFGYATNATGFQLELKAYNETCGSPDADGHRQTMGQIEACSETCLTTPIPLHELEACLSKAGLPVTRSTDPGRYLCNFLYYNALRQQLPALFVHIPALRIGDQVVPDSHSGATIMTLEEAVTGAELIITYITEHKLGSSSSIA